MLLSSSLHPLLFQSSVEPICISASSCLQPVDGFSDGPIQRAVENSQLGHLELNIPSHIFPLEGPNESFRGKGHSHLGLAF